MVSEKFQFSLSRHLWGHGEVYKLAFNFSHVLGESFPIQIPFYEKETLRKLTWRRSKTLRLSSFNVLVDNLLKTYLVCNIKITVNMNECEEKKHSR